MVDGEDDGMPTFVGEDLVCGECGAAVAIGRSGRYLHVEAPSEGSDPAHEARPVERDARRADRTRLTRVAVEELVAHHATMHPASDCAFVQRVLRAVRE